MAFRSVVAIVAASAVAAFAFAAAAPAGLGRAPFAQWIDAFRSRALARGVSSATYARVTDGLEPDTTVFDQVRNQPELSEQLWQYLNRRVSDWRITAGKEKLTQHAALLDRIEHDYGVERSVIVGIWGIESAYGDPVVQTSHMRPVFPALAALAWGEPRRRTFWERQFLDALVIVERGWSAPADMVGSWAGAMGHTQWMPEVWLNVGFDYDGDGRVSPFGDPADALGSTARYLVERGKYRRGEHWGYEVRVPAGRRSSDASRTYTAWQEAGVARADAKPFPRPHDTARLWVPVPGGPTFLLGPNFYAVRTYNPSMSYTLSIVLLGDRVVGGAPLVQTFPGSEPPPTLAEVQEIQRRLTALGLDTGGTDGRIGNDTMRAVREFQRRIGMKPADGYAGVRLLARLRNAR